MGLDDFDFELQAAIEELVATGDLDPKTPAHGIALQVITSGRESLSPQQSWVFDKHIVPLLRQWHDENERNQIMNSNPD